MSELAHKPAARPFRYTGKLYAAFQVSQDTGRTYRLKLPEPICSPEEARDAAMVMCSHKDKLIIRETDEHSGAVQLHLFAIKRKSQPTYVYRDYQHHREHRMYADPICAIDGGVLLGGGIR